MKSSQNGSQFSAISSSLMMLDEPLSSKGSSAGEGGRVGGGELCDYSVITIMCQCVCVCMCVCVCA